MKWMKHLLFWQKDEVIKAGNASIQQYSELYKKLDAYDKGDLSETEVLSKPSDLRKIIQSSQ